MNLNRRNFLSLLGITPLGVNLFGTIENSPIFGKPFTTVYKVVDAKDNGSVVGGLYRLFYNDFTQAKVGKIFIKKTFKKAKIYAQTNCLCDNVKILKCRTKTAVKGFGFRGFGCVDKRSIEESFKKFIEHPDGDYYFCGNLEVLDEVHIRPVYGS